MTDKMLLGALRAPAPDPGDVVGITHLHEAAKRAADILERMDRRQALLTWRMDECSRAASMVVNAVQGRSDPECPYEALDMAKPDER